MFAAAWSLFRGVHGRRKVRLLGVYASGLGGPAQMPLFAAAPSPADRARDLVDGRFGEGALRRASLLGDAKRPGDPTPDGGSETGATGDGRGGRRPRR